MKKTYTEEELKEIANGVFVEFPNANKVYATLDGNVFLDENRANLHAGVAGRVFPFDRPIEVVAVSTDKPKQTAAEIIATIELATSLEELQPFETDKRATVIKALEAKREALIKAIEVDTDPTPGVDNPTE